MAVEHVSAHDHRQSVLTREDARLVRITGPRFVAGLEAGNGRVVRAAPILRFMVGMSGAQVAGHCADRGWHWECVA